MRIDIYTAIWQYDYTEICIYAMLYLRHTEQNNDKNFQIFNILVKYKKKSITFVAKTEFMRARIMFDWAGNVYDWDIDWPLPFFPRKGIISYLQFPMFV